ncbi:MAG: phosphoadenylyl-sulfate reductase, partial [Myxococcota bacterium]
MPNLDLTPSLVEELDAKPAQDVLAWALGKLHPRIAFAWSGAEDVVVLDLMLKVRADARVFTLDTGRLNPETYDVMERVREKYGLKLEVMFPRHDRVETMVRGKGLNLFYASVENRKECCGARKVEPLGRALADLDGWVTGLRRDQAVTRTTLHKVEIDAGNRGILKVNPIADWSHEQVWAYIKANGVPYNTLHDKGYPSIGCAPCTRAVEKGEDIRAGRWWWENPETK